MNLKTLLLISTLVVSKTIISQSFFQNTIDSNSKDWGFIIAPYALLASQSTDVGGEKIRQSFNDLSSITNTGFQLCLGVRYKKFILSFDGTWAELGSNQKIGPATVHMKIVQNIFDAKLGYVFYSTTDYSKTNETIRGWSIEGNIGTKYWLNDVDVNFEIDLSPLDPITGFVKEKQEWFDLMLGAKARFILNKKVLLGVSANIGGFGIGNSSKFAWDLTFVNTFKVYKFVYVTAGFRSFKYKRIDGEGANQLETNVSVLGPLLGVSFTF